MKYKIITEESMDIDENFAKENDIEILPIEVNFNGEIYPDGLPKPEFYEKLKGGVIPKTSAPNQYRFETALEPYANKEDWFVIVCVISAELSGTIAQAKNAVESLPPILRYFKSPITATSLTLSFKRSSWSITCCGSASG